MNQHFITALRIDKVRHLSDITINLSPDNCRHLILTGKNGSGKTSVLEALAAYLNQYLTGQNDSVKFSLDTIKHDKEKLRNKNISELEKTNIEADIAKYQNYLATYYKGVTAEINNLDTMLARIMQGEFLIAYYKAERSYNVPNERKIDKVHLKDQYGITESAGNLFVKYLLDLKTTEAFAKVSNNKQRAAEISAWFANFDAILKKIFANDAIRLDFDIETYEFKIIEPHKEPFTFETLSSGYAAVMDIVADLLVRMEKKHKKAYDMEGIVLIDEIETHLHLELQKNILPILTGLFPNIQFIVTTHSPFILNSLANTVVYDLANKIIVNSEAGLSNLPYSGIVEGYFKSSELSAELEEKFLRYKQLAAKETLTDDDYEEITELEFYLDEIPDYLALGITTEYEKLKLELAVKGENNG